MGMVPHNDKEETFTEICESKITVIYSQYYLATSYIKITAYRLFINLVDQMLMQMFAKSFSLGFTWRLWSFSIAMGESHC